MTYAESCGDCGAAITPTTSFISETGVLCGTCFSRWEAAQRAAQNATNQKEAVLHLKASRLGRYQGVTLAAGVILLAGWVHLPGWLSTSLVAAAILIAYGMRLRSPLAFRAALVADSAGSLIFAVFSITQIRDARLAFLLFPVAFSWWLGLLTWRAREAFVPDSQTIG